MNNLQTTAAATQGDGCQSRARTFVGEASDSLVKRDSRPLVAEIRGASSGGG